MRRNTSKFVIISPLRIQLCIKGPKYGNSENKWGVNIRKEHLKDLGKSIEKK